MRRVSRCVCVLTGLALMASFAPMAWAVPHVVDFDTALTYMSGVDASLAPDQDRNGDGIPNGDELALVAAVLADDTMPIHDQVYDAFMANWAVLDGDLNLPPVVDAYGQELVDAVVNVGAAWMMWDSLGADEANATLRTVYWNTSGDGVYNLIYADDAETVWNAAFAQFVMLPGIASQTGDANGDGTTNLAHYQATGTRGAYLDAALNFDFEEEPPPLDEMPAAGPLGIGLLVLLSGGGAVYALKRKHR